MSGVPTTIFAVMSALAEEVGAINLGQGFPDESGPDAVIDEAVAALRDGHNQYAPLAGVPALRAAIVEHQRRHYGIELDPDLGVQVTFGATEALINLARCSSTSAAAATISAAVRNAIADRTGSCLRASTTSASNSAC